MRTYVPSGREAEELQKGNQWIVVDASGQVLGRLAARVARLLLGKDKPRFTPHMDCGDHVVVINSDQVRFTGNKLEDKQYSYHSGYPGGLKQSTARARMAKGSSDKVVRDAIVGMLPKNKLQARRARKLRVYRDAEGLKRHTAQKPQPVTL
jgi:large subunit ribosomal protein L13